METVVTRSQNGTQKLAAKILARKKMGNLWCLYGDLGSGKTTFVQGLAKALGIRQVVQSPTFILLKEYLINPKLKAVGYKLLIHVDCYRLESEKDLRGVNLQEYWQDNDNLVVVEWAERIKDILPKKRLDICFENLGENKRKISIFEERKNNVA